MIPPFNDYVALLYNRFEAFVQSSETSAEWGPYVYKQQEMIVFFMWMQFKKINEFKAQGRWLMHHEEVLVVLGWSSVPHRTTLSRRYKKLYSVLLEFIAFFDQTNSDLAPDMSTRHLNEDKSCSKPKAMCGIKVTASRGLFWSHLPYADAKDAMLRLTAISSKSMWKSLRFYVVVRPRLNPFLI